MRIFQNRVDAGKRLAEKLVKYRGQKDTIAVGLARGGVVVAYEVGKLLNLPCDLMVVRKIGAPHDPELALGAVSDLGSAVWNDELIATLGISKEYLQNEAAKERELAKQRKALYLKGQKGVDFASKTILLIDDGIATGASVKLSISLCKERGAKKIVVAVPIAPEGTCRELEELVDEVISVERPARFRSINDFYQDFPQVTDDEIIQLIGSLPDHGS